MWYKNEDRKTLLAQSAFRITTDDRFIVNKDHSLTITNVRESDEDTYLCNILPSNITMKAKLQILTQLMAQIYVSGREATDRSMTFRQGESIDVECKAAGQHATNVNYIWSSNGNRIITNDQFTVDGGRLIIKKADRDHVRIYQCLADNGSDETGHASVTLNIQCKFLKKFFGENF